MRLNSAWFPSKILAFLTVLSLIVQASHYDAESGIYIGPSRKLSEDESILASLSLSNLDTGRDIYRDIWTNSKTADFT